MKKKKHVILKLSINAVIEYDKEGKSYFIQSKDNPNIYSAANNLEDLILNYYDVVDYYRKADIKRKLK